MSVKGIGSDIIEVQRIEDAIARHGVRFLERLFTEKEQAYCLRHKRSSTHFAGRFAAKEAVVKALGTGFGEQVSWLDIEVTNDEHGKPEVKLSAALARAFPNAHLFLTISHCDAYATASAILTI